MKRFLAYNAIDGEYESFDTIDDARGYLEECFLNDGVYHPEMDSCCIFELKESVTHTVVRDNKWRHEFKPQTK